MCTRVYVHMLICMHVCMLICIVFVFHVYLSVHTLVCMCAPVCMSFGPPVYVLFVYMYTYMCLCVVSVRVCMREGMYSYINACTRSRACIVINTLTLCLHSASTIIRIHMRINGVHAYVVQVRDSSGATLGQRHYSGFREGHR